MLNERYLMGLCLLDLPKTRKVVCVSYETEHHPVFCLITIIRGRGQEKNNCREEGESITREKEKKNNTKGGACSLLIAVQSGK